MALTKLTQVKGSVARALASIYTPRFSSLKAAMESTWAQLGVLESFDIEGYHEGSTEGGGRFFLSTGRHNGGTFIDPDREFPSDWGDQSQLEDWFLEGSEDVTGFERHQSGVIKFSEFGCLAGYENSLPIVKAIEFMLSNNCTLTGNGNTYTASGTHSISDSGSGECGLMNVTFKSSGENTEGLMINISAVNKTVNIQRFTFDGDIDNKYSAVNTLWYGLLPANTGASFGVSIWPVAGTASFALVVEAESIVTDNIKLLNSHSCGFRFIGDWTCGYFKAMNTSFTSAYSYADDGAIIINKYYAKDVGRNLPTAFDVNLSGTLYENVSQDDGYYAQGAFGLRIRGNITLNKAIVKNFYTTGIVIDTGSESTLGDIYIESNESVNVSNQFSAGLFYELSTGAILNSFRVKFLERSTSPTKTAYLYGYSEFSENIVNSMHIVDTANPSVTQKGVDIWDNEGSVWKFNSVTMSNNKDSSNSVFFQGVLNIPSRQPGSVSINDMTVRGRVTIDFRDFRNVEISGVRKVDRFSDYIRLNVGDYQAAFPNTTEVTDSQFNVINGVSAGSGFVADNIKLDGTITIYGESNTNTHSSISNSELNITGTSIFDGTGNNTTLRFIGNVITGENTTLNIRTAGVLKFTDNIGRYNGSVNLVSGSNLSIVDNYNNTFLKGASASAPVGYALNGSVQTNAANNNTIAFDYS